MILYKIINSFVLFNIVYVPVCYCKYGGDRFVDNIYPYPYQTLTMISIVFMILIFILLFTRLHDK